MRVTAILLTVALSLAGCRSPSGDAQAAVTPMVDAGPVYLASLEVTLVGSSNPSGLMPAFSPAIHDYYVRCGSGLNVLQVSIAASPGALSAIVQPRASLSASSQTVTLDISEGEAVVASAVADAGTEQYWVRCLPHDFPVLELTRKGTGSASPGYYLVGNTAGANSAPGAYAMVLDGNGVPVWFDRSAGGVFNVDTLTSGVISYISPATLHSYEEHALSPLNTKYLTVNGVPADEHDLRLLPNGDYLLFTSPNLTGVDLTGLTLPLADDADTVSLGPNGTILDCVVNEIDPGGNLVWQWTASDHFDPVQDMTYPSVPYGSAGAYTVEPFHCNSIDVDASGGLLISARHMDSVFYVDKTTGNVLWKMGGSTYTKDGAIYVPVADPFYRQHDARFLPSWTPGCSGKGGSGQISVFDDETGVAGPARGVVYDVNVASAGCATGSTGASVAWQFKGKETVAATGSFRMQPNGGSVVGWGTTAGLIFTETDAFGNDLLDLSFTDGSSSYRAIKVPTSTLDLAVLRSTVGENDSPDAGALDAGASDADAGAPPTFVTAMDAGVPSGCYATTGSGASQTCTYTVPSRAGACPTGTSAGSCPAVGLYGCCIETPDDGMADLDGGASLSAICYYSPTTGQSASSQCGLAAYEGMPFAWQTTLP